MGPARLRGRAGCVRGRIDRVAQNPTGRLAADGIRALRECVGGALAVGRLPGVRALLERGTELVQ